MSFCGDSKLYKLYLGTQAQAQKGNYENGSESLVVVFDDWGTWLYFTYQFNYKYAGELFV